MPLYRTTVRMPYVSNLPRDIAENVFHFLTVDPIEEGGLSAIHNQLVIFYNSTLGDVSVGERISPYVSRNTGYCSIITAEVHTGGPKIVVDPPLEVFDWTLTSPTSTTSLPFEVSVCLSFGSVVPGVARGRTRGRVYIGPLCFDSVVIGQTPNQPPHVDSSFCFDLGLAATSLLNGTAAAGVTWGVFSRVNRLLYPIEGGWVDNEFDTQRRRQVEATSRTPWTP